MHRSLTRTMHRCLMHKYSKTTRPLYLTPEGFSILKRDGGALLDHFRLHTDSLMNVLRQLDSSTLTVAVIMDAQDWFDPSIEAGQSAAHDLPKTQSLADAPEKPCQLKLMIAEFARVLKPGGRVFWRSAAMRPWYAELYKRAGFVVEPVSIREVGTKVPIDGVNMCVAERGLLHRGGGADEETVQVREPLEGHQTRGLGRRRKLPLTGLVQRERLSSRSSGGGHSDGGHEAATERSSLPPIVATTVRIEIATGMAGHLLSTIWCFARDDVCCSGSSAACASLSARRLAPSAVPLHSRGRIRCVVVVPPPSESMSSFEWSPEAVTLAGQLSQALNATDAGEAQAILAAAAALSPVGSPDLFSERVLTRVPMARARSRLPPLPWSAASSPSP